MMTQPLSAILRCSLGNDDVDISGMTLDSRQVTDGDLFIAVKGEQADGHDFVSLAIKSGAAAVLVERELEIAAPLTKNTVGSVPVIVIEGLRARMGELAQRFYNPQQTIPVIGVTGTNGKTSVADYVAQLLQAFEVKVGVIGTLGVYFDGQWLATGNTTPDVISVHRCLSLMRDSGCDYAVMEVSSHALVQGRVDAVNIQVAVFTNLSHDHLDYHGTLEAYREAKAQLFNIESVRYAIINDDDEAGHLMAGVCGADISVSRYSLMNENADAYLGSVQHVAEGYRGNLRLYSDGQTLNVGLSGRFNLLNVMASILAVDCLGFDRLRIVQYAKGLKPVRGRMESVANTIDAKIVVDYAHTPDALDKALAALRDETTGRLIVLFGCGGDRDSAKRPLMGKAAESRAHFSWITSDNPRTELPLAICDDIAKGYDFDNYVIEADRHRAIEQAVASLQAGDTLLVAGKGHETYQLVGNKKLAFDDVAEVKKALKRREAAAC